MPDGFVSPFLKVGGLTPDGKPIVVFTGKDDFSPSPVEKKDEGSKMECPICHGMFDYLVGDDTPDGGKRGCETCYRSPKGGDNHGSTENNLGQGQEQSPEAILFNGGRKD